MSEKAIVTVGDKSYELPVITGTENEKGIDISKLRGQSGLVTYDVGFKNTGSTTSAITFLNGEEGVLRYRGYAIEDLANKASFLEVAYLVVFGELPTQQQLDTFSNEIKANALVHEDIKKAFDAMPQNAHPMGQLMSLTSMLSTFHPESQDPYRSDELKRQTIIRLIAKLPVLAAMIMKKLKGEPFNYPDNDLDYVENFLYMTFSNVSEDYVVDPVLVSAMNKLLILHADHEQNCSASTVRIVGSSHVNLYASVAAGIAALWGPLHGGANQAVLEMLEDIRLNGGSADEALARAKDKDDPFRLMGFGHRVYKNFDPRARIIKKSCDEVLDQLGVDDPVLDIAKQLENAALNDPYFADRKLYPNVDFYSGIIYRAMGFPVNMFTVLFAIGRLPGWIGQWKEMRDEGQPIGRPRQVYIGETTRDFVPIANRNLQPA